MLTVARLLPSIVSIAIVVAAVMALAIAGGAGLELPGLGR